MGCFTVYCFICGNPCYGVQQTEQINGSEFRRLQRITRWMWKCTILTSSGGKFSGCKETNCNVVFQHGKQHFVITPYYKSSDILVRSIYLHDDCFKYIDKQYGVKLDYSMIIPVSSTDLSKRVVSKQVNINHGLIEKYWNQYFMFDEIVDDNNEFMLYSPLKSDTKNLTRIKKIYSQLKIKKNRSGPSISASLEPNGCYRLGNDGYFWQKKNGKWMKIAEKPVKKRITLQSESNRTKISLLPQICESTATDTRMWSKKSSSKQKHALLFVKIVSDKIVDLIGTEETLAKIK